LVDTVHSVGVSGQLNRKAEARFGERKQFVLK
jgi:hypothetical protein